MRLLGWLCALELQRFECWLPVLDNFTLTSKTYASSDLWIAPDLFHKCSPSLSVLFWGFWLVVCFFLFVFQKDLDEPICNFWIFSSFSVPTQICQIWFTLKNLFQFKLLPPQKSNVFIENNSVGYPMVQHSWLCYRRATHSPQCLGSLFSLFSEQAWQINSILAKECDQRAKHSGILIFHLHKPLKSEVRASWNFLTLQSRSVKGKIQPGSSISCQAFRQE